MNNENTKIEKGEETENLKNLSESQAERFAEYEKKLEKVRDELIAEIEKSPDELLPPEKKRSYIDDLQNFSLDNGRHQIQNQKERMFNKVRCLTNIAACCFARLENQDGSFKDGAEADYDLYQTIEEKLLMTDILVIGPENSLNKQFDNQDQMLLSGSFSEGTVAQLVKPGTKFSATSSWPGSIIEKARVSIGTPAEGDKNLRQWRANVAKSRKFKAELLAKKEATKPLTSTEKLPLALVVDEKILKQLLEDKKFVETIANLYKSVESWEGIYSVGVSPRALDSVTKLHEVVGEQYDQEMGKPISKNKVEKGLQQLTFAYIQRIIEEQKRQTSKAEIAVKTEQPKNAREALQLLNDSLFDDEKGEYGKFFEQILQKYQEGEEDKVAQEILGVSHIFNKLKNREAAKLALSAPFWEEMIKKEVKEDLHRTRPYYPYFPRFYGFIEALCQAELLDKAKEMMNWIIDWEEKAFSSKYKGKYAEASGAKEWLIKYVDNFKRLYEKLYPATTEAVENPTEVSNEKTPPTIEKLLEQIEGLVKEKELKKAAELVGLAIKRLRALLAAGEAEKVMALGPKIIEAKKAITEALANK